MKRLFFLITLLFLFCLTAFGQAQSTLLEDNLDTDGRDATKWNLAHPVGGSGQANSGSVTLTETDASWPDRLSIVGPAGTAGTNLGGYESVNTFNCSTAGCVLVVEVVETEKGRGHIVSSGEQAVVGLTLGTEWHNGITVQFYDAQKWELIINQNGTRLLPAGTYLEPDSVDIHYFRFRLTASTAWIDTSPDGVEWANRASVAHAITITALRAWLWGGTFGSQTTAFDRAVRKAVFDNFSLKTMPYQPAIGSWETAAAGATVSLSGSSSIANGATVTSRSWTCESATGFVCPSITNSTSENASFTAPTPSGDNGSMRIRYTVVASTTTYIVEKNIYVVKTHAQGYVTVSDPRLQAALGYLTPRGSGSPNRVSPMEAQLEERIQIHGDYAPDIGSGQIRGVATITNGSTNVTGVGTKFTEDIAPAGVNGCTNFYGPKLMGSGCGIVRFDAGGNPDAEWVVSQVVSDTQLTLASAATASVTLNDATTVFVNSRISSIGNVYSNAFPEGINYYDFVWLAYQYYYRTGNPKFLTIATRWGHAWASGYIWRNGRNLQEEDRRWGVRGIVMWAILNPSDPAAAKVWDQMQDKARERFDFRVVTSPTIKLIIDVRETFYTLIHGGMLGQTLPDTYEDRPSGTNTDGAAKRAAWASDLSSMFPNWLEPQQHPNGHFEMFGLSTNVAGMSIPGFLMGYTQPFMEGFLAEATMAMWPVLDSTGKASAQRVMARLGHELYSTNRRGGAYARTFEVPEQPGYYHRGTQYAIYGRVSNSPESASEAWDPPLEWTKGGGIGSLGGNYLEYGWMHEGAVNWDFAGVPIGNGIYTAPRSLSFMTPNALAVAYYVTGNPYFQAAAKEALDAHAGTDYPEYNYGFTDTGAGSFAGAVLNATLTGTKPFVEGFRTGFQSFAIMNLTPPSPITLPGAPAISLNATAGNQITINITHGSNATRTTLRRSENPDGPFLEVRRCQFISASTCVDGSTSDPTGVGRWGPRNGRSYYYKAYSINGGGYGTDSPRIGPITLTATSGVPNPPTALTLTDAGPSATDYFTASWAAPATGPAPTGYRVEYSYESIGTGSPARWMPYSIDTTASTSFTFTASNLVIGSLVPCWNDTVTYFVRVFAFNASGESQPSNEDAVLATCSGGGATRGGTVLPATPTVAPSISGSGTTRTITFPAAPNGWHHWIVKRKAADDEPFTIVDFSETGTSYVDTVPNGGATYYYAVSSADSSNRMGGQSPQIASSGSGSGIIHCNWSSGLRCQ